MHFVRAIDIDVSYASVSNEGYVITNYIEMLDLHCVFTTKEFPYDVQVRNTFQIIIYAFAV